MLEFLRQHVGGMLGLAIIGALVFVFAVSFGAQSSGWGQGQTVHIAATVEGEKITEKEFDFAINLAGGREVDRDSAQFAKLKGQVLEGLIERQLLVILGRESGVTASRDEAEQNIVDNRLFFTVPIEALAEQLQASFLFDAQIAARVLLEDGYRVRQRFEDEDGHFDLEGFQNWVRYGLQVTEETFVEQQRLELITMRVRKLLVSGVRVSEDEVRAAYDRENDTVSIRYVRLTPAAFSERLEPTDGEIDAWAAEHGDAIEQYYETNKFRYTNLEKQVRARHILLKVAEDASDEEKAARRAEIEAIAARLEAGEDFAALARELSEDGSAAAGGDLGWNPRGRMVPEFDAVMFELEPGSVSDVVETKFGLHLIRVEGVREGNVSLEEARREIAEKLYREAEGARRAMETAEEYLAAVRDGAELESLVPEDQDRLPPQLRLQVRTTQPFGRGTQRIAGLGRAPEIAAAAFELTPEDPAPERVFQVRDDLFVIQLDERTVPSDADFAEQKARLAEELLALKQASWLRDRIRDLKRDFEKRGRITAEFRGEASSAGRPSAPATGPAGDLPLGPKTPPSDPADEGPDDEPAPAGGEGLDEGPDDEPAPAGGESDAEEGDLEEGDRKSVV